MSILLLAGSPSSPSRSQRLLREAGDRLALADQRVWTLQVRDLPAQALLHADFAHGEIGEAIALVAAADALVIATPVYKAAYSGVLKAFLDLLPQDGLKGKLVLPLATGGSQSHMLALDYALRPVLATLGARHVLPSIYATDAQVQWSEQHGLRLDAAIDRRIDDGLEALCDGLAAHGALRSLAPREPLRCDA